LTDSGMNCFTLDTTTCSHSPIPRSVYLPHQSIL
jgi:hypothetical protein